MISKTARVAELFRRQPGRWVDGRELATVGGAYAWRTRLSECRRPPFSLRIENRQRRVVGPGGTFIVSEYRLAPPTGDAAPAWELSPP